MTIGNSQLALELKIQSAGLEIEILNQGAGPVRVWDRNNSWGWGTLVLDVASSSNADEACTLTPQDQAWTRNGPGFVEIPPGESHLLALTNGNPEWESLDCVSRLRGETLRIRANLRIAPSPEAETYKVFVGEVSSEWRESKPPHLWLFADA